MTAAGAARALVAAALLVVGGGCADLDAVLDPCPPRARSALRDALRADIGQAGTSQTSEPIIRCASAGWEAATTFGFDGDETALVAALRPQLEAAGFEVVERAPQGGRYASLLHAVREDGDVEVTADVVVRRGTPREHSVEYRSRSA